MENAFEAAKIFGTFLGAIVLTLFGNKKLNKTANKSETTVEEQLNLRIDEKNKQILELSKRVDELEKDLEKERSLRADDQKRYQGQLDDLRERFDKFRNGI